MTEARKSIEQHKLSDDIVYEVLRNLDPDKVQGGMKIWDYIDKYGIDGKKNS